MMLLLYERKLQNFKMKIDNCESKQVVELNQNKLHGLVVHKEVVDLEWKDQLLDPVKLNYFPIHKRNLK